MFETMLPIIGPVMVCVLIGFIWKKWGWPFDTEMVTRLIMCVAAPCLIVSALTETTLSQSALQRMFWVTLSLLAAMLVVSVFIMRISGQPIRSYLGPLVFPNTGNMGLPICLFAFGDQGLVLALAVFMVISFVHFTFGIAVVSGRSVFKELVSNPIIYSLVLAVAMVYTGYRLPRWAGNTVSLLGDMTIPLMLLTLGVSLAQIRVNNVAMSLYLSVLRLGVGTALGWSVAWAFGLQGTAKGVIILQATMPVAVFNYLFAVRYQRNPDVVAGAVMVSTLLSFIWLPLVLTYLL